METGFIKKLISVIVNNDDERINNVHDGDLVKSYSENGDESAFEEIVSRYSDRIYGLALRITRNDRDAEEVFQEVFLTLSRKLDTFRGDSKFSSWLYRVTVNASYMYLRSQKNMKTTSVSRTILPMMKKERLWGASCTKTGAQDLILLYLTKRQLIL